MPDRRVLRVLVVDDEPLAVQRLQLLLARCDGVEVVGVAHDGKDGLTAVEQLQPDIVLLDIAMPGMDGIEVAHALGRTAFNPVIIFVTAFDNFAVAAFDVAAVDYLMKPIGQQRLERAIDRAREHLSARSGAVRQTATTRVEEFWVPDMQGLVRVSAADIERVTAERDYMRLHVGARSWLIHRTIAKLEEDLDSAWFLRVHRSVILRKDMIRGLVRDEAGRWVARLADGGEQRIGRSYVDAVRKFVGRG